MTLFDKIPQVQFSFKIVDQMFTFTSDNIKKKSGARLSLEVQRNYDDPKTHLTHLYATDRMPSF